MRDEASTIEFDRGDVRRHHRFLSVLIAYRWFLLCVGVPTVLTTLYYGFIASDRYVSEAQFIVRRVSDNPQLGGLSALLKATGISGGADEASAVQAYIRSRNALTDTQKKIPLQAIYGRRGADFIARWPSLFHGETQEELYKYYNSMIDIAPNQETGVMTLKARAFDPEDARTIVSTLLGLSEDMVNRINARIQTDSVRSANDEVKRAEDALETAQASLTVFRNRELLLDPDKSAIMLTELIGKLNSQLADLQASIAQIRQSAPDSPQLAPLLTEAASIEKQIDAQRKIVAASGGGLANKVAEYERLNLEKEFAARRLAAAVQALTLAQVDARRQQLFLEPVVAPSLPDKSTEPRRLVSIITVFGWSCLLYLIVWLVSVGIREHAAEGR